MVVVLLALIGPIGVGYLLVRWLWPERGSLWFTSLFQVCLGVGLGLGASSAGFFVWLTLFGSAGRGLAIVESILVGGLCLALLFARRQIKVIPETVAPSDQPATWRLRRLAVVVLVVLVLCSLFRFVVAASRSPHGDWDAWAIWNLRARFLYRGGDSWRDTFTNAIAWSHPDYPLLVPGATARCWYYAGEETTLAPQVVAGLFTLATVGLLIATVGALRGRTQGYLAGIVLLGTFSFVELGHAQYADVPLGYLLLASLSLLIVHDHLARESWLALLAGLLAGFAAWTKNEGALLAAALFVSRAALLLWTSGWRTCLREMLAFALGLLPLAALLAGFKLWLAPANDLLAGQDWSTTLAKLADGQRYLLILSQFAQFLLNIGPYAIPLLILYCLLLGRARDPRHRASIAQVWLILALALAGYFVVYLTTPWESVLSHIQTSLDRLLLQLWPTFLLAFFLGVASPEEAHR
jgi:hypothetical protein